MNPSSARATPWWRIGTMWLVLGGPAAVVVASFVTLALCVHGADPVLPHGPEAVRAASRAPAEDAADAMTPAMQARNHAAHASR